MQHKKNPVQNYLEERYHADREAEQNLLTCLLANPYAMQIVADTLQSDHFSSDNNMLIYQAMHKLYGQDRLPTIENVADELDRVGKLDEIGGKIHLYELSDGLAILDGIDDALAIVLRKATMRKLKYAAQQIAVFAEQEDDDAAEKALQLIYDINLGNDTSQAISFADAVTDYIRDLDQRCEDARNGVAQGIPTRYTDFDHMTGGLQKASLITLGALTGFGKSAFALNVALNIALSSSAKRILFFSLEMRHQEIVQRALSIDAEIDQTALRDGLIDETALMKVRASARRLAQCDIRLDDRSYGINAICNRAKREHARKPLDLIILDYLQLVEAETKKNGNASTRAQEVADLSRRLKRLAQELDIPVIALVQLNRKVEERQEQEPKLADINESGGIARDSDVVAFLYSTKEEIENREKNVPYHIFLKVAKNRNGRLGTVTLQFNPRLTKFREPSFHDQEI